MARKRAKSMDQRSFGRSCTAGAAGRLVSAAHGFPGIRQNASIRIAPRVHKENVGSKEALHGTVAGQRRGARVRDEGHR